MADNLTSRIVNFALDYMEQHGRVDWSDELKPAIEAAFGKEIARHWTEMAFETIRRSIKKQLARNEDTDEAIQTQLPGFRLPKGIAVPQEGGGVTFVSTLAATRGEARAQLMLREANIINAQRRKDEWERKLDRLEVAWRVNADFTVGECVDYLAQQGQP